MKSNAIVCNGEQALLLSAYGPTATKAFKKLGPLIDQYIESDDAILQGINVYVEKDLINLTATISVWK
jgi:hypothetical protein